MSFRISSILLFLSFVALSVDAREPKSKAIKTIDYKAGDYEVTTRFLDVGATNFELRIKNIVKKSLHLMNELFGGHPKSLAGCDDTKIIIDLDTKSFHGEADPGWVEMGLDDRLWFGFITIESGLIHELFHLWNAETFRYAHRRDQWFSEGCTEYYAIKLAIQSGLIDKYDGAT